MTQSLKRLALRDKLILVFLAISIPPLILLAYAGYWIFSAFFLLLTLGAGFLTARGWVAALERLTSSLQKVSAGNLTVKTEIPSQDEFGRLAEAFNEMTTQLRQTFETSEQHLQERTRLLEISAEIGRAATAILLPDELIHQVVNLITQRFGITFTALYLVDELGEWAELRDATGEARQTLKERHHRVPLGGQNMVGTAITTRQSQMVLDIPEETGPFKNPLLPPTHSEITLPLIAGDQVLGVLDLHAHEQAVFNEKNLETFQNMANQIAIAIQTAFLYQQTQQQLAEISRLNRISMQEGWQSFHGTQSQIGFLYKKNRLKEISSPQIPDLEKIVEEHGPVFGNQDGNATMTLPFILRDQLIGALHLITEKHDWDTDDLTIIETVTRQAALAFENARLVEATQLLALREQQINQISSLIRSSIDIETILKTTLSQLATTLNVQEASIQLSHAPSPPKVDNGIQR